MSCRCSDFVVGLSRVWLSLGLVVSLMAGLLMGLPSPAGAVAGYGDVGEDTWYTDAVQWSTDNGITDIAGPCFGPDTPVSRGETAVWIYNMENQPDTGDSHSFTDVTDDSQNDAISWMAHNEVTTGKSPTTFAPADTLTRAEAATFLHRLADKPSAPPHNFSDVVAAWQQDSVSWMAHTGITTGTSPTTFAPGDTLNRAQLITFLYRYQGEPDVTINPTTPTCQAQTGAGGFKTVSAGTGHNCGVRVDDTITCWGWNEYGQADEPDGGFKAVVAGSLHSCGIRVDDTITCWGYNSRRQADAPAGAFKAVVARGWYSCGIRVDDTITCWGYNGDRQADAPDGGFKTVVAGSYHSCGIRVDDTIACWGARLNDHGQADAPDGAFKTVSASNSHSCGIRVDGTITCWGANSRGQADAPAGAFKTVSAGWHSCGIRVDDTITCWGYNSRGQADAPAGAFKTVSVGSSHSCGIRVDDTMTCWGDNSHGQADAPTNEPATTPTLTTVPPTTVWGEATARIPVDPPRTYTQPHGGLSPDHLAPHVRGFGTDPVRTGDEARNRRKHLA